MMTRSFSREEQSFVQRETSFDRGPSSFFLSSEPPSYEEPRSEGFDEYFDPPLESKYECPICLLGLREPVQTTRGHRFCKGCILRSIRDAGLKCPVDNERLDASQLYPDNFAKREMLSHDVFCRLKKQHGCPWKGPLSSLENHLKECEFVDVNCPKNCGKQLKKKDLKEHLEKYCPNRTVPCNHCKEEVKWNGLENHFKTCPKYPLKCRSCRKENIPRDMIEEHQQEECLKTNIKCPFSILGCTFEGLRPAVNKLVQEQLTSHLIDMMKGFAALKAALGAESAAPRSATRPRGGQEPGFQEQASHEVFVSDMATLCQQQRAELDELRRLVTALNITVQHMEHRVREAHMRHDRSTQELSLRCNHSDETRNLERRGCISDGSYLWNPAFYTRLYGYKRYQRINLNYVNSGLRCLPRLVKDLPFKLQNVMARLLNPLKVSGNDWRMVASELGLTDLIPQLEHVANPTIALLRECASTTTEELLGILEQVNRADVVEEMSTLVTTSTTQRQPEYPTEESLSNDKSYNSLSQPLQESGISSCQSDACLNLPQQESGTSGEEKPVSLEEGVEKLASEEFQGEENRSEKEQGAARGLEQGKRVE